MKFVSFLGGIFAEQTLVCPVKKSAYGSAGSANADLAADKNFPFSGGVVWLRIEWTSLHRMPAGVDCATTGAYIQLDICFCFIVPHADSEGSRFSCSG